MFYKVEGENFLKGFFTFDLIHNWRWFQIFGELFFWSDSFFFFLCCPLPYSLPSWSSAQTSRRGLCTSSYSLPCYAWSNLTIIIHYTLQRYKKWSYHEDENVILSILFKYLSILDMLSTPFLVAQNGDTKSKTKTLKSLKVTKLVFAFYFFPLARILSASTEIYY